MIERGLVDARAFSDFVQETEADHTGVWQFNWPSGTRRTTFSTDPESGAEFFLLQIPPGYVRPAERELSERGAHRFEWHSCHEEIFCLEGEIRFGNFYRLAALGYLNHPPFWVHPADQYSDMGATLLIRNSGLCDFAYEDIPAGWDGVEYVLPAKGKPSTMAGVTTRSLTPGTADDQAVSETLYRWDDGMVTEACAVPAGWSGFERPVGTEMIFVLAGDIGVGGRQLGRWGYSSHRSGPERSLSSNSGAVFVRWAR